MDYNRGFMSNPEQRTWGTLSLILCATVEGVLVTQKIVRYMSRGLFSFTRMSSGEEYLYSVLLGSWGVRFRGS